jgi:hypothetical protein
MMLMLLAGLYHPESSLQGQAPTAAQPPLFFREGFNARTNPGFFPLVQGDLGNSNLQLQLYGPGATGPARNPENTINVNVQKTAGGKPIDDAASFIWTGMAEGNWAVTLKHKDSFVDLSRPGAKIRWRTWQDGAVQVLRPLLKLADGTYVLGLQGSGTTADFETTELMMADMRWVEFDIDRVLDKGNKESPFGYTKPDLTRVDEVGFSTLSRGGGHGLGVSAHIDWIEVYGTPVARSGK